MVLVFASGYLIIYNIFQISVASDIRFYGRLKTLGTIKKMCIRDRPHTFLPNGCGILFITTTVRKTVLGKFPRHFLQQQELSLIHILTVVMELFLIDWR